MDFSPPNKLRFRNFLYARRHALAGFVSLAVFSYLFFSFVIPILAAPPTTKYDPGETLNPTCAPGDPNCTVTPPISGTGVSGRVTFFVSTSTVSSTAAFYWDNTNGFLGLGTSQPSSTLHVVGGGITQSGGVNSIASTTINGQATTTALSITSISGSTQCLHVNTNGVVSGSGSDCGAGSISGNGTSTQIAFYSGTSTLTSSANFTFATSTNTLSVTGDITVSGVYRIGNATTVSITGTNNLFVGSGTGVYGSRNTFSGSEAGATGGGGSANDNAFFGYQSGYSSTAARNSAFGSQAGANIQDNFDDVFVGYHAGYQAIGGSNVFVGSETGINNAVDGNTFIGYRSGYGATSGARNVFLGFASGSSTTTGADNVFLGYNTGAAANVSNAIAIGSNIFINASNTGAIGGSGFKLGIGTTQPSSTLHVIGDIAITGDYKIASTTVLSATGSQNIFVGKFAGNASTTGSDNTFIGNSAGTSNTSGQGNLFAGLQAGKTNSSGGSNVFLGINAGFFSTTASNNTFVGANAGQTNTTSTGIVALGASAGLNNTAGNNTFVGFTAAANNTNGAQNTVLGYEAGYNSAGSNNVFLGFRAGYSEAGSNKLYIANSSTTSPLIYGDFSTTRLGIGTSQPSSTLHVIGDTTITATTTLASISGSTQCLRVNSTGVISGTGSDCGTSSSTGANPTATIGLTAVNGTASTFMRSDAAPALSQAITPTWTGAHIFSGGLTANSTSTFSSSTIVNGQLTFGSASGTNISVSGYGIFPTLSSSNAALTSVSSTNITASGYIQTATLSVSGVVNASSTFTVEGATTLRSTLTQSGGVVSLASTTINGQATTTGLSITSISGSTQCLQVNTNGTVSGTGSSCGAGNGNVSVATANTVAGYIPAWTTSASSTLSATSSLFWDSANGRIGIGTIQPSSTLHVVGTLSQFGGVVSLASTTINGQATTTGLSITGLTAGSIPYIGTGGVVSQNNTNLFWDNTNTRLGIGTNAPINALSVVAAIATTSKASIAQSLTNDGSAPTTISSSSYLNIGGAEFGANSYRLLTFGYRLNGTDSNSPAYIGYQEINVSGRTNGDLIFGTRNTTSDVAPSERLRITTAGAILVATTTTPTNALLSIATSGNIFTVLSTNRVGIGTGAPATALDVISDGATVSSTLNGVVFARDSTAAKGVTLGYDTATGNGALAATGGTALGIWTNDSGWAERVRINASGSVGIGTTQPSSTLHVVGGATITTNVTTTNLTVSGISGSTQCLQVSSNGTVSGTGSGCAGNGIAGSGTSTQLAFFGNATTLTSDPAITYATTTGVFAVSATSSFTGKVGIGTATPLFSLHVSSTLPQSSTSSLVLLGPNTLIGGSASGTLLASNQPSSFNGHFINFQNNSSTQFFISASGTVGVGTISPPGKFAIITTSTFKSVIGYDITDNGSAHTQIASSSYLHLGGAEFGASSYRLLTFGYRAPAIDTNFPAYMGYQETNSSGRTAGDLVFGTRPTNADVAPTERLRIRKDGTIEIGNVGQSLIGGSAVNIQTTSTYMVNIMRTYNGGTISAITSVGSSSSYLHLGGAEFGLNSYRLLSFGWHVVGSTTNFPAYIGFQEKSTSGNTLGDLVFGTRDNVNDTAATERIRITSGGLVGIGTDSPSSTLHVVGTSTLLMTTNVAIGTITPLATFHVAGTPIQTASGTLILFSSSTIQGGNVSGTFIGINTSSTFNGDFLNFQNNSSSKLRVTSSGVMFVAGGLNASSTLTVESGATLRSTLTQSGGVVSLASTTINGQATTTALTITSISGSTQCLRVDTNGVVSGTGSACGSGTITGGGASGQIAIFSGAGSVTSTSNFTFATSTGVFAITATSTFSGKVGIGEAPGLYQFHLLTSGTLGQKITTTNSDKLNPQIDLVDSGRGTDATISSSDGTTTGLVLSTFSTHPIIFNTAQVTAMTITSGQKVGIGTTQPSSTLHVIGDIAATGAYKIGANSVLVASGTTNIFAGINAGNSNTTGASNSYLGYQAGYLNVTGTSITAVGYQSGYNNTVGANTFLGTQSGYWDTTGAENTFVGYQAGYNTDTSDNAFFGYSAGTANSTGQRNTYLGARAGASADGSFNVLIGYQAGNSNTGAQNTIIGYRAGVGGSLSGGDNIFIGSSAGSANGAGNLNVFIGSSAGSGNDSGASNISIGYLAGTSNSTGSSILAIGDHAGNANTVSNGVFLGYYSGQNNSVGVNNTFVGTQAGRFNTTGNYNMFSGDHAGYNNSTGSQITAIGTEAGYNNKADNNVFLGYQAGYNNVAGTGNIFIGYQAGYNASTSNNLYIDNSNAAIPLIYGDFANDRIGLGTANPDTNAKITIVGTTSSTLPSSAATVLVLGSSDGTTGGSSIRGRGTITGGLADVGEFAKVEGERSEYSAGDVLVISVTSTETFAKSSSSYQSNAVGIVTETAGILAGGGDETITYDGQGRPTNRVMIALAGRVPVKVSLENGAIQNGDYLTSSGKAGVAMKQTAPGPTIGRAMEVFDENSQKDQNGVGKVIVFVESGFSLGSGELVFATSTIATTNPALASIDRFTVVVQNAIAKLGIIIADGVARMKELFADKVTTKELCIDDLCVNKAQLQQLLQQGNGNQSNGGGSSGGGGSTGGDTGGGSGGGNATTTPPTGDPSSSSTDPGTGGGTPPQDTPPSGGSNDGGTPPAGGSTDSVPPSDSTPPADTGG